MILTDHQRELFLAYCDQEAESYEALAKQLAKLPNSAPHQSPTMQSLRLKMFAFATVANHLRDVEDMTIGGEGA